MKPRGPSSLRARIIISYLLLVMAANLVLTLLAGRAQYRSRIEEAEHVLENESATISNSLEDSFGDYFNPAEAGDSEEGLEGDEQATTRLTLADLQGLIEQVSPLSPRRMTVLYADGTPLFDSALDAASVPNQIGELEVQEALHLRFNHDIRYDPQTGQERLYTATAIEHQGLIFGVVQISEPMVLVWREVYKDWLSLGLMSVLVAGISVAMGAWVGGQLLRPLAALHETTELIAAGDLARRAPVSRTDELGALAHSFNEMVDRVSHMLDQQKAFVANASHELRTPLTNIRLRGEALLEGGLEDTTVARQFVEDIVGEAARLGRIVADLLTLSRLDRNLTALSKKPARLEDVFESFLPTWEPALAAREIHVTFTPGDTPPALIDDDQMVQVLGNLFDNALKFTPVGGQIAVRTWAEDGQVCLSVADTGSGIPPEDLPHIFERFYQGGNSQKGTGLGLAIASSIVEAHGGTIAAESAPGGTVITLRLPAMSRSPRS